MGLPWFHDSASGGRVVWAERERGGGTWGIVLSLRKGTMRARNHPPASLQRGVATTPGCRQVAVICVPLKRSASPFVNRILAAIEHSRELLSLWPSKQPLSLRLSMQRLKNACPSPPDVGVQRHLDSTRVSTSKARDAHRALTGHMQATPNTTGPS